jgi:hypothetical protein
VGTKVYGASDDLIEFDGDVSGEVMIASGPSLLMFSDGTILTINYGDNDLAIWKIVVLMKGSLFKSVDICTDEDADVYSDVVHFQDGLTMAFHSRDWARVK